jgi:MFS family permease
MGNFFKNPVTIVFISYVAVEICKITGYICGPAFQRIYDFSDTQLGLIFGSLALGGILVNLSVGHFVHRFGIWAAWLTGVLGVLAALVAILFARGYWSVFIPIFLLGMVTILMLNANGTFLSDLYSDKAQQIMGLASGIWFGSSVVSAPLIGCWIDWATSEGHDWLAYGGPYIFDLIFIFVVFLLGYKWLRPALANTDPVVSRAHKDSEEKVVIPAAGVLHRLYIILIALAHACAISPMVSWLNPMVQEKFSVGDFKGSVVLAVMALGLSTGRIAIGMGFLKMDNRVLLSISGLTGGTVLFMGFNMPNYISSVITMFFGGVLLSATAPCLLAMVPEKFFSIKSHIFGYVGVAISLGAFAAPWFVGFMADSGFMIDKAIYITPISAFVLAFLSLTWKLGDKCAD